MNNISTNTELEKTNDNRSLMINAFLIGLFIGVIIYGVAKNNIGFFGLIPILIAFRLLNKPKNKSVNQENE